MGEVCADVGRELVVRMQTKVTCKTVQVAEGPKSDWAYPFGGGHLTLCTIRT